MNEKEIYFIGPEQLVKSNLYKYSTISNCLDWLKSLNYVCLDSETEGMFNHQNKMIMLQLYCKGIGYVIDTRYTSIKDFKPILENILVIGQNLKFDYKFLKLEGIELNSIYDTFLAECCLTNGLKDRELGLAALALKYCGKTIDKSVRNQFINLRGQPFTEKQIAYGLNDVSCLEEIKFKQEQEVERLDIVNWVKNENNACLPIADMEYNGMGFNSQAWLELAKNATNNLNTYEKELDNLVKIEPNLSKYVSKFIQGNLFAEIDDSFKHGRDINITWSSPTQMAKVFAALGLQLESTQERFLTKYQDKYPIVKKFIDYKKEQKLVTTYGEDFLKYVNPITKRVHTSFWQILDTSRLSSGDKEAANMQNLPAKPEYRAAFIPRKGFKLVTCDFSGQELRLTAFGSKEPLWINAYNRGEDLHSNVASMVFKVPLDKVKEKPDFLRGKSYRDAAKTVNFGLVYGMSKYKLADTLNISIDDADKIIKDYFKATPALNKYLSACRSYGLKYGYIRSFKPYSIIRYFPQYEEYKKTLDKKLIGEIERCSMNTPIQSSGAQMMKRAMVNVRKYIKSNNLSNVVFMVMTVHDQLDCEVEESFAEEWAIIQKNIMEEAGREMITGLPVVSDMIVSDFWKK